MDLQLKNKSILVTGGNRGIGLSIALGFAAEGANVAICGRDQRALDNARQAIEACGVKAVAVATDLFTAEGCELAVSTAFDAFGGLDVLVNNASTNVGGQLETLADEQLIERFMGKTLASMRCSRAALPHLRRSGAGRVICIGGAAARFAARSTLPSGLGNASTANFVKHLSNDVAADGITVNIVHPSFTKTDRYPARRAALAEREGISLDEAEASFASEFPIGRIVEPADIAPMVMFLASPLASAITGQAIAIDGGSTPQIMY
ncbi:MAG: 3-oxoacyl-[acyl-carrier protein] reductase [Gammaproteobacteria bacterium]|jgi:3-oxoacyl-[acyl-carrier protein] reductase